MASFSQISRDEKRRIADELLKNLVERKVTGAPDSLLDPFIAKLEASRDHLGQHVEGKTTATVQRSATLTENDIDDDEVDRWYRHIFRYTEVESLRRHAPEHAAIDALLASGYPRGLVHVDDRVPDQNEEVRRTLSVYRDPQYTATISAMKLPTEWIDLLDGATKKSDASFAAYQALIAEASSATALGRDAEAEWVVLMRALDSAISLRSAGADLQVVEEGKRLLAPLKSAVRLLRSEARARATKREKTPE